MLKVDRKTYVETLKSLGHSHEDAEEKATAVFFDSDIQTGIPTIFGMLKGEPGQFVVESKSGAVRNEKGYAITLGGKGPFYITGEKRRDHILGIVKKLEGFSDSLFNCGRENGTKVSPAPK